MVSELGYDAWAVVHLLLESEVPQVPMLLVHLPTTSQEREAKRERQSERRMKKDKSRAEGETCKSKPSEAERETCKVMSRKWQSFVERPDARANAKVTRPRGDQQ